MRAHRKKSAPPEQAAVPEDVASVPTPEVAPEETAEYWREHCLRAMAEVQNLKRRASQEIEERTLLRLEGLLSELLRVDDYFTAALDHVPAAVRATEGAAAFLAGIGAIRQALESVLLSHGAVFLAPGAETPFDPAEHEAVEVVEREDLEGERLELLSRGCRFGRRILRPARVRLLKPAPSV
ncbi:MAG: nucleotide exchange factor GrpE [Planctomycetota bacterium]|nr:nucleotide exchange factor GrpE [Planctomycetota bacterium]